MSNILKVIEKRIRAFRKGSNKRNLDFELIFQSSRLAVRSRDYQKAACLFQKLLTLYEKKQPFNFRNNYAFFLTAEKGKYTIQNFIRSVLKDEQFDEAEFFLKQIQSYFEGKLLFKPNDQRLLLELGKLHLYSALNIYNERVRAHLESSIIYLTRAMNINSTIDNPLTVPIIEDLSDSYFYSKMYREAILLLEIMIAKNIYSEKIFLSYAQLLEESGDYDEALRFYDKALELNPQSKASVLKTYPLLMQGNFDLAWKSYKSRGRATQWKAPRNAKQWEKESLENKTILVYSEGGIGDELYFLACFNDLLEISDKCILVCDPRHDNLFQRSFPNAIIQPFSRPYQRSNFGMPLKDNYDELFKTLPEIDYYCMIGDLNSYFRVTLESFKKQEAYIIANETKALYWKNKLNELGTEIKVGICWRSGYRALYRERESTELEDWLPILNVPGFTFINLMYDGAEELQQLKNKTNINTHILDNIDLRNDLDSLAALISSLDLVISVDTYIAELSGALGQTTWRIINSPYIANHFRLWPGTNKDLLHPSMIQINSDPIGDIGTLMTSVKNYLISFTPRNRYAPPVANA